MEVLLDFARGPLFRLSFSLMILGLIRIIYLEIGGILEAYGRAGDKNIPWGQAFKNSLSWLIPIGKLRNSRPIYSVFSILFHIGLLLVPIFLFAHVALWEKGLGIRWFTLGSIWADALTLTTIVTGIALVIARWGSKDSRFISRRQDYLWPLLLLLPFGTGFICSNMDISPAAYQWLMLLHVMSANVIFVLIPFSKISHCVINPLSQFVITLAWKFPANKDEDICITLNKPGAPV